MYKRIISYLVVAVISLGLTTVFQPFTHLDALASKSAQGTCQTFKETGKTVCGRFLQYWQQNGGLAQQGYPISNEFMEVSELNGKEYRVQYFERAVFELHPENKPPYDVLLSQLGTSQFKRKYPNGEPGAPPPTPVPPPGVGVKVPLQEGVTIMLSEKTRISQGCGKALFVPTFSIENNGAVPYTFMYDAGSNRASDSTGKMHTPGSGGCGLSESSGRGFSGQQHTLAPRNSSEGYLSFTLENMAPNTTHIDVQLSINGRPLVFRYPLK